MKTNVKLLIGIFVLCVLFTSCDCCKDDQPEGLISIEKAVEMQDIYVENQYEFINNDLNSGEVEPQDSILDNREYWFTLKELRSYLCYIEKKADSLGYDKDRLGIRVYNAAKMEANPNASNPNNSDELPEGAMFLRTNMNDSIAKSTIFFVGTHQPNDSIPFPAPPDFQVNMTEAKALNYGSSGEPPKEFIANP